MPKDRALESAKRFVQARNANKRTAFMNTNPPESLLDCDIYLMYNGTVGFVIGPGGYFTQGLNNQLIPGAGGEIVVLGIAEGGIWGDPYGKTIYENAGFLPDMLYPQFGFAKVEEYPFDPQLADPLWNREKDDDPTYCKVVYMWRTRDADEIRRRARANGAKLPSPEQRGRYPIVEVYRGLSQSARERLGEEAQRQAAEGVRGLQRHSLGLPAEVTAFAHDLAILPLGTLDPEVESQMMEVLLLNEARDEQGCPLNDEITPVEAIDNPTVNDLWRLLGLTAEMVKAKIIDLRGRPITSREPITVKEPRAATSALNVTQADLAQAIREHYEARIAEQQANAKQALLAIKQKYLKLLNEANKKLTRQQFKTAQRLKEKTQELEGRLTTKGGEGVSGTLVSQPGNWTGSWSLFAIHDSAGRHGEIRHPDYDADDTDNESCHRPLPLDPLEVLDAIPPPGCPGPLVPLSAKDKRHDNVHDWHQAEE
ncbi:MAG: hypothetical protein QUS33_02250 [Dehalococcoidia bacterium]|nr:hypothetical protein [Dehalococcoidia bacterium]